MFDWFLSIFLETKCPLCKRATQGDIFCRDCDRQLNQNRLPNPKCYWQGNLPLFAWGRYDGILKRAIATLKYDNRPQIGEWLGAKLGQTWQRNCPPPQHKQLIIIPIPMHAEKQRERGFNQAELIAQRFAQVNRFRCLPKALHRTKATKALFNLSLAERQQEIQDAFTVTPQTIQQLKKYPVLLVDDICTSGTTALEASRTLKKHGISVLGIAAIATPKTDFQ